MSAIVCPMCNEYEERISFVSFKKFTFGDEITCLNCGFKSILLVDFTWSINSGKFVWKPMAI